MKRIVLALFTLILLTSCGYIAPIQLVKYEFSENNLPTANQMTSLIVTLNRPSLNTKPLNVFLETDESWTVLSKQIQEGSDGKYEVIFDLRPEGIGSQSITLRYGTVDRSKEEKIDVLVEMPGFFRDEGSSYTEMVEAPDEYIYGAHITTWPAKDMPFMVTGHAASNVCKKVSGALYNFALTRSAIDDDFILVAGFASLSEDPKKLTALKQNLHNFKPAEKLHKKVNTVVLLHDLVDKMETISDDEIIGIISETDMHQQDILLVKTIISEKALAKELLRTQMDAALSDLKILSQSFLELPDIENTSQEDVDKFIEVLSSYSEEFEGFSSYVASPTQSLKLLSDRQWLTLKDIIIEYKGLNNLQQSTIKKMLSDIMLYFEGNSLLSSSLDAVSAQYGLLKRACNNYPHMATSLKSELKSWSTDSSDVNLHLGSLIKNSNEKFSPNCDPDTPTVIPVPYYNSSTGEQISFVIPVTDIFGPNDDYVKELLESSVQSEMRSDLIAASERFKKSYDENLDSLQRYSLTIRGMNADQFSRWLREEEKHQLQIMDPDIGKIVRVETVVRSNKETWVNLIGSTHSFELSANNLMSMALQIESNRSDPVLNQILEYTLIDSFLRKWDLSFVDNSMDSPYDNWIKSARNKVWQKVNDQMLKKNISIMPIVNESTVFKVRRMGDSFVITPYFVANFDDTVAVKSRTDHLVYYENRWNNRKADFLKLNTVVSNEELSPMIGRFSDDPQEALNTLANNIFSVKSTVDNIKSNSIQGIDTSQVEKSLYVSPEYTANAIIEGMWSLWEGQSISKSDIDKFRGITIEQINRIDKESISSMSWPLVDHYLYYKILLTKYVADQERRERELKVTAKSEAPPEYIELVNKELKEVDQLLKDSRKQLARFEKNGDLYAKARSIDESYVDKYSSVTSIDDLPKSTGIGIYSNWKVAESFERVITILSCLSSAYQQVEQDDSTLTQVNQSIRDCHEQLVAMKQESTIMLVYSEEVAEQLITKVDNLVDSDWDFSRLGRAIAQREISEVSSEIASPAISIANTSYELQPTKEMLSALVKLKWYAGEYKSALNLAMEEIYQNSDRDKSLKYLSMVSKLEDKLLKALVYSGAQINFSIFGRNDWVVQPKNIEKIPLSFNKMSPADSKFEMELDTVVTQSDKPFNAFNDTKPLLDTLPDNLKDVTIAETSLDGGRLTLIFTSGGKSTAMALPIFDSGSIKNAFFKNGKLDESTLNEMVNSVDFELISTSKRSVSSDQAIFLESENRLYVINGDSLNVYQSNVNRNGSLLFARNDITAIDVVKSKLVQFVDRTGSEEINKLIHFTSKYEDSAIALQRGTLPDNVVSFYKAGDAKHLVYNNNQKLYLLTIKDNRVKEVVDGEYVYSALNSAARNTVKESSIESTKFVHIDTYLAGQSHMELQIGETSISLPEAEVRNLLGGKGETPTLDNVINALTANNGQKDLVFYRDSWERGRSELIPSNDGAGGNGKAPGDSSGRTESDPPGFNLKLGLVKEGEETGKDFRRIDSTFLALALKKKYKKVKTYIDDETQLAINNIGSLPSIESAQDIGAYIPDKSVFHITDHDIVENISSKLIQNGIELSRNMDNLERRNIIVITGHRDDALKGYIKEHLRLDNFKDKYVALISCYEAGSENLNHLIVREGGAKGVLFFSNEINPTAVQKVMIELGEKARTIKPGTTINLEQLMDESAEEAVKKLKGHQRQLEKHILDIKNHLIQVSSIFQPFNNVA